jgi:hypothetical protein
MRSINDRDISFLEITAETQSNHYNFLEVIKIIIENSGPYKDQLY